MKQLLYLLFAVTLFTSCSSDDDPVISQDYTSFIVINSSSVDLPNCIAGYEKDGSWIKVAELGTINKGVTTSEIRINDTSIKTIYIFTDYLSPRKLDKAFNIEPNKKNRVELSGGLSSVLVSDKKDSTQYPK